MIHAIPLSSVGSVNMAGYVVTSLLEIKVTMKKLMMRKIRMIRELSGRQTLSRHYRLRHSMFHQKLSLSHSAVKVTFTWIQLLKLMGLFTIASPDQHHHYLAVQISSWCRSQVLPRPPRRRCSRPGSPGVQSSHSGPLEKYFISVKEHLMKGTLLK